MKRNIFPRRAGVRGGPPAARGAARLLAVLALALVLTTQAWADTLVRPGDTVGGITITNGGPDTVPIWAFCNPDFSDEVGVSDTPYSVEQCSVPFMPHLGIGHGWYGLDEAKRDDGWAAITWELYFDGRPIDLAAFGALDIDLPVTGLPGHAPSEEVIVKLRTFDVALNNPTAGAHTLRTIARISRPIFDGFTTTQAGTYEKVVNFTVEGGPPGMPRTGQAAPWLLAALAAGIGLLLGGIAVRRQQASRGESGA